MSIRPVKRLIQSKPTREGAGVHLRRAFGFGNTSEFDPFLLRDEFHTHVRVVCGTFWGMKGPVDGVAADPIYLDVSVPPGRRKTLPVETTRHAFAYVFGGSGKFCNASGPLDVPTESVRWLDTAPPSQA